jgi:hypothetical protein
LNGKMMRFCAELLDFQLPELSITWFSSTFEGAQRIQFPRGHQLGAGWWWQNIGYRTYLTILGI